MDPREAHPEGLPPDERMAPPLNTVGGVSFPPVICRRLKPGDRQPFEWWDVDAGRWARGEDVPASIRRLAPRQEVERWNCHWWDYLVQCGKELREAGER